MFTRILRIQLSYCFRQRITQLTMLFLFLLVGTNYINNVILFKGTDIIEMYHPMKLLLLSFNRGIYSADSIMFFMQLYPLLLAFPAGSILAKERLLGIDTLMESRIGNADYIFIKVLVSFLTTAIVFSVPFLIEIVLNCLAFPLEAAGDFYNYKLYDSAYQQAVNNYLFPDIYRISPYLYAVIHTFVVGICSGIIGAFITALSSVVRLKYSILYLFPPFILFGVMEYVRSLIVINDLRYAWFNYIFLFSKHERSMVAFVLFLVAVTAVTLFLTLIGSRRDCL